MATFLTGSELNSVLEKIFDSAEDYLILISPYIKLHDRYASALKEKKDKPDLKIVIVFGKNEEDISKSMKVDDFNFFKEFPNIEIRYEKRLHAKYYASQDAAILTSMNLYNYSQDNNIEAGVLTTRKGLLGSLTNNIVTNVTGQDTFENQTADYFDRVIKQSELLFSKVPQYESAMLGLSKRYTKSVIEKDILTAFFNSKSKVNAGFRNDDAYQRPTGKQLGYCIRTGSRIPFNPKHPMSDIAFQNWKKFENADYPEKFCHFSGEVSNGETTFAKPVMRKNWAKAKEIFNL